jgi:hypothetical protein
MNVFLTNNFNELKNVINKYITKILIILSLILFYAIKKEWFLFLSFILLDIAKYFFEKYIKLSIPIYPIDYGIVILSYLYNPFYSLILIFSMIIIRLILIDFKSRHLLKIPILAIIAYISYTLKFVPLTILGPLLFIFRYIIDYSIKFMINHNFELKTIPQRVINIILTIIFYSIFSRIILVLF